MVGEREEKQFSSICECLNPVLSRYFVIYIINVLISVIVWSLLSLSLVKSFNVPPSQTASTHLFRSLSLSLSVAVEREQQVGGEISLIPLSHMTENESYLII
jgi:hypothetical protein